jgi:hypothetical protein
MSLIADVARASVFQRVVTEIHVHDTTFPPRRRILIID